MIERKHDFYRVQSEASGPSAGPQHDPLVKAVEEISEDEAVEETMDLAVAVDRSPAITVEEQDITLGSARTLLQHASIVNPMTIQ